MSGIFSPELSARDPRGRGSTGAGIVLDAGAYATASLWPAPRPSVTIRPGGPRRFPISREVASRLLGARPARLEVELRHELPIGQGFGMSAAGATATALAVGELLGTPRPRRLEVAHLAELFGGGGLGGVASIQGGGWEIRRRSGIPPRGQVEHRAFRGPVVLCVVGRPLRSPKLLVREVFLERVRRLAAPGLQALRTRPTRSRFFAEAEQFTDAVDLTSPAVRRTLDQIRSLGVPAAQAMFGESLWAAPSTPRALRQAIRALEGRRLPAVVLGASPRGAELLSVPIARPRATGQPS